MLSMQNTSCRTLIWIVALMMPVQTLPAASCGCDSGQGCCQADGELDSSCCQQEESDRCCCTGAKVCRCGDTSPCKQSTTRACCGGREASATCCAAASSVATGEPGCKCGANCQCGTTNAPGPAVPPVENTDSTEKVVANATSLASDPAIYEPRRTLQHANACGEVDALAALDRCVSLCRFTL